MLDLSIIGGALALGLIMGFTISRSLSRKVIQQARAQAAHQLAEARQAATRTLREMEAQAREKALQLRQASEALERQSSEETVLLKERVRKLEAKSEEQEAQTAARQAQLDQRSAAVRLLSEEAHRLQRQAKEKRHSYRIDLEKKAGETARQVMEHLAEALAEEARAQCADRLRNLESTSSEEFMRQAKRIMGITMGRYSGHFLTERSPSSLLLSKDEISKLTARVENLNTIEELTGVHLALAENTESVRFEGGDGAARELARRVVTRFIAEDKVRDLSRLIKAIAGDLDREIMETGKEAFRMLGLDLAQAEIIKLVGRLNFRTSYTQNQWQHSLESAFLAGLMAAELGLDVCLARRGALLHDIGKALTHELEGSHAMIGAEYMRKNSEDEIIANAIASHHGDEPPRTPYAYLVAAADAISGARPGARREMMETYVDRIAELERIATQFNGVIMVHSVQAGRELRVHVDEQQVDDTRSAQLSDEIAKKISQDVIFPGQIRVMVIREFKAIEFAS